MAIYNTASDSANTAVRAFLTKVGEFYLGHSFNTGSGRGKLIGSNIRDSDFNSCCAYCGERFEKLQIEHVFMFNRTEFGLHHPGNTVPCCQQCNKRGRRNDKGYFNWNEQLRFICEQRSELEYFDQREKKIRDNFSNHNYPKLNHAEQQAIKVIANSLYENIKLESEKSLNLYKQLDKAFVKESP